MAVGDSVTAWVQKADAATTNVQPAVGVEWLVHTLVSQSAKPMEVYLTEDGTTFTLVDAIAGGSIHGLMFRLTNTTWMRLKNTSGGVSHNGYQGVVTRQ
jgi:hypothetical protein